MQVVDDGVLIHVGGEVVAQGPHAGGAEGMAIGAGGQGEDATGLDGVVRGHLAQGLWQEHQGLEKAALLDERDLGLDAPTGHVTADHLIGIDILTGDPGLANGLPGHLPRPEAEDQHHQGHGRRPGGHQQARLDQGGEEVDADGGEHAHHPDREPVRKPVVHDQQSGIGQGGQVPAEDQHPGDGGADTEPCQLARHIFLEGRVREAGGDDAAHHRRHGAMQHAGLGVPVGLARPHHEGQDADDHQHSGVGGQAKDHRQLEMSLAVHPVGQIDQHVDAHHLDDEEHPLGSPHPDEVVDQGRDAPGTGHRGRIPDTRPGDRAQDVAEHQQEEAVTADEFQQVRSIVAVGVIRQEGEKDRRADGGMGEEDVNRGDDPHDPSAAHPGFVPGGIEA